MKVNRRTILFLTLFFLAACSANSSGTPGSNIFQSPPTATSNLPTASVIITSAPDVKTAVSAYFDALKANDLDSMYTMLSQASREAISLDNFKKRYNDALNEMSMSSLEYAVLSTSVSPYAAEAAFNIVYHTVLAGDIKRDNILMRFVLEDGKWKVQWEEGLILPELIGGRELRMEYKVPPRGNIYDRDGTPLVAPADVYAFSVNPSTIDYDTLGSLSADLAYLCGFTQLEAKAKIEAALNGNWDVAMCEGTKEEAARLLGYSPGGLVKTLYKSARYYFNQGLAPQVIGYTQSIPAESPDEYRRLGYPDDARVGMSGIEKWAENYLSGKRGGALYVYDPNTNQKITRLGESAPQPASSVYLTLDDNLQYYVEQAIRNFRGAAVVIERDTGRVLAMASSPDFDPNMFDPDNPNNEALRNELGATTNQPLLNRAAQGQYPLGSVFKVITMSAALESGLYVKDRIYDCQYAFEELGNPILYDWTWQHCQDRLAAGKQCNTSDSKPSGPLNLQEGLMRSCDPYFWHIGLDLYRNWNRGTDITNMALAFGLGAPTGILQIEEEAGTIPVPTIELDATNQAIGQGGMQVTPLQVASFIAAIGNGGTLYRPQLIEKIQPIEGDPTFVFKPEPRGTLPLRDENLKILQEAMWMVVNDPRGTAYYRLRGLQFEVAGKTGTAQTVEGGKPHAWFAGYTLEAADTGKPDIAIVVVIEHVGEGSDFAAPIFQRIVDVYYTGTPAGMLWFESSYGVLKPTDPPGGIPQP